MKEDRAQWAVFTKEVSPQLAKRPLKTNGRLANRGLTSFVKEATGRYTHSDIMRDDGLVVPGTEASSCTVLTHCDHIATKIWMNIA